ncbi:MAG: aminoacyl-tRNA hydrolase [Candidatus Peribacteraceae bacterium]|nr:aminoacyl-tRNA hydrolase [Candidatus Peribacteraceae bacterium]
MKPSFVIVGLGNPGAQYADTRHNAGFRAVDILATAAGAGDWQDKQKFLAYICEAERAGVPVLLVKPQTFMNRSGECVRKLVDFFKLDPAQQLLVISDDVDLPIGEVRFRSAGGPGTHNGLKSVVEQVGEGFPRLRIGLGAPAHGEDLAAWVLSVPSKEEAAALERSLAEVPKHVEAFLKAA